MSRFHGVYDKLNQALYDMPYEKLGISEEVKEQVELMCMQLKRAKRRTDTQDIELAMDMMVVFSENDDRNADNAILERLAIKLELHTIADLKTETIAVRKLVNKKGAHTVESTKKIVDLLEKFIHIAGIEEISVLDNPVSRSLEKCRSLLIPNEFLCPITLEIMTDPVIVATGQSRAIKAGIVPPLLHLLEDKNLGMVDEALSILLLLASHPEGRNEIGKLALIETLVEIIRVGTPKNKECATAVLLELGLKNSSFVLAALQYGVYDHLAEIARCGTSRAQRKANSLLQHMSNCEHIPRETIGIWIVSYFDSSVVVVTLLILESSLAPNL
ncbi:U-box domain-containing protein 15 [Camellia lanceoleosa]|uniref:U-box domain-containing protein 15 n=1 Tax=Camellia lanceoleosa TaxID=1840588 RepID=A0ACC0IWK6_9ERIC|nr:U-box domain-containing protein 15 [Camellia lanceoleosa]